MLFFAKMRICCHRAATKKSPKYRCFRRLVAGWQQKLKFKVSITSLHTSFHPGCKYPSEATN